jgi:hypothetical protein
MDAMEPATDRALEFEPAPPRGVMASLCPVDRMPRRRRNKICVGIIAVGALNFVVYTLTYATLGGDAHNGSCKIIEHADGTTETLFYVRGHFIRSLDGREAQVSRPVWIYSYLHSMSVFVTSAAMIISMLVLARPHILATMRGGWISGQTFVAAFGTVVILVTSAALFAFAWGFVAQLRLG